VMETLIPGLWILPGSRSVRDVERIATQARSGSMVLESHLAGGLNAWVRRASVHCLSPAV